MNCFMSYNPNVAKEVKITTWIKEFDGASPIYPSFPKDGDVFIVFDSDEDKTPSVNKTFSSGDWADTGGGSTPTGTIEITENGEGIDVSSYAYADVNVSGGGGATIPLITAGDEEVTCDTTFSAFRELIESSSRIDNNYGKAYPCVVLADFDQRYYGGMGFYNQGTNQILLESYIARFIYSSDGTITDI